MKPIDYTTVFFAFAALALMLCAIPIGIAYGAANGFLAALVSIFLFCVASAAAKLAKEDRS